MQPSPLVAMRFSTVLLILAACVLAGSEEPVDIEKSNEMKIDWRYIKNGVIQVKIIKHIMILNLTKNDGENMINVLYTKTPLDTLRSPLTFDPSCSAANKICVRSGDVMYTVIEIGRNLTVINVTRNVADPSAEIVDCYQLTENTQWFGGTQMINQHWPIQHKFYGEEPCLPTHPAHMAICERYWLSSKGVYLYVSEKDPLFIDQNNYKNKYLCLMAKNKAPYRHRESIQLNYELGVFADPRTAHQHAVRTHLGKPNGHPDERMIRHPIWSTWARYRVNISENVLETYAGEIVANGFSYSQLEIDDNWETCYGSAEFDPVRFPNVTALVQRLKRMGFRVSLWTHPFIDKDCEPAYSTALNNSYFAKSLDGSVEMQWWQGDAGVIDFTNPTAVSWWVARLKLLQKSGIDSFKLIAGEVSYLPEVANLTGPLELQPGIYTRDFVTTLIANFGPDNIEVQVGWRSQELPVFVRMIDKDTSWRWNNGLPTLIPTLLQMNLNGYVHVHPGMIGGNGDYFVGNCPERFQYPSKELFIRWLQASVFMPSLRYSFVPWDFDNETVTISRKYTELHAAYTPKILEYMQQAIEYGNPVNPPIWWVDPTNEEAHRINDEYLLGDSILVAPVIEEDAVTRDVYLPAGTWHDPNREVTSFGPKWLRDYPAPLDVLPYFIRTKENSAE